MPRIRQYADKYAAEDFRKEIRIRQGENDLMSQTLLAAEVGIPRTTLIKRLAEPMGMSFGEFRMLNKAIHPDIGVVLTLLGYTAKEISRFRKEGGSA